MKSRTLHRLSSIVAWALSMRHTLAAELLHRRDDFARGFTEKMMAYALGRGLVISDY